MLARRTKRTIVFVRAKKCFRNFKRSETASQVFFFASNNRFQYFQKPPIFPSSINNNKKERGRKKKTFFIGINARKQVAWKYNVTLIDIKILQRTTLSPCQRYFFPPWRSTFLAFPSKLLTTQPILYFEKRLELLSSRDFTRLRQKFPLFIQQQRYPE